MTINPNAGPACFPILLQAREHEWRENSPTDIWQRTYVQGETVEDDRLQEGSWTKVAALKRIVEKEPCFTDTGQPAYVRAGKKKAGLYTGTQALVEGPVERACFSPDGQLAYTREGKLWLARADGSEARLVEREEEWPVEDLEFSANGNLWYSSDTMLYKYDPGRNKLECLDTPADVHEIAVAPDGRSVAYLDNENGIHRLDLVAELPRPDTLLATIPIVDCLSEPMGLLAPASLTFSPDGSRLLFVVREESYDGSPFEGAEPETTSSLWAVGRNGGRPVQVDYDDNNLFAVAVPLPVREGATPR